MRVEILDAETGNSIPGFDKKSSDSFGDDRLHYTVTWKRRTDVAALRGKAVQLRFHLDKAKLFTFQFGQK